ncbi:hypothetical protein [Corticibacter populi]|nr:hypothetical protein [Corticibacter populi]
MSQKFPCPPSLTQQFEPLTNAEPGSGQRDRLDQAHAIFVIVESLRSLGLAAWSPTLLTWLGRFDGLNQYLREDAHPLLCVRQVLLCHVADLGKGLVVKGPLATELLRQQIIDDLVEQDFVHHRCYWSARPPRPRLEFNPLEQTWLEFVALGQVAEDLCVWRPERGNPLLAERSRVLLMKS